MDKREEIKHISESKELLPIGTLLYEDFTDERIGWHSTNWQPHRVIWRVKSHEQCQAFPGAPITTENAIELVRTEPLIDRKRYRTCKN